VFLSTEIPWQDHFCSVLSAEQSKNSLKHCNPLKRSMSIPYSVTFMRFRTHELISSQLTGKWQGYFNINSLKL